MTDGAFAYHEDVAVRSIQKKSALHKAQGSAVPKLGNKLITTKEIMEKHGPVITYLSLDGFMDFQEFDRLPNDLKIEYVNKLCDKYDIDIKHISRYLFNKGDDGLRAHLRNNKISINGSMLTLLSQCNPGKNRAKSKLEEFKTDILDWQRDRKVMDDLRKAEAEMKRKELPPLMTFDKFKAEPLEWQIQYINKLIQTYQIPATVISEVLFEHHKNAISNYFSRMKATDRIVKLSKKQTCNKEYMYEKEKEFRRYVDAWREFQETDEEEKASLIPVVESFECAEEPVPDNVIKLRPDASVTPGISVEAEPDELELIEKSFQIIEDKLHDGSFRPENNLVEPSAVCSEEPDAFEFHEMHVSSNYISNGINMAEIYAFKQLFGNRRIKVNIEITEV